MEYLLAVANQILSFIYKTVKNNRIKCGNRETYI